MHYTGAGPGCGLAEKDAVAGMLVVRGPNWKWGDQVRARTCVRRVLLSSLPFFISGSLVLLPFMPTLISSPLPGRRRWERRLKKKPPWQPKVQVLARGRTVRVGV